MTGTVTVSKELLESKCKEARKAIPSFSHQYDELGNDVEALLLICEALVYQGNGIVLDINTFAQICKFARN